MVAVSNLLIGEDDCAGDEGGEEEDVEKECETKGVVSGGHGNNKVGVELEGRRQERWRGNEVYSLEERKEKRVVSV